MILPTSSVKAGITPASLAEVMEPDRPILVKNILDLRIHLFLFSLTKGVSHIHGGVSTWLCQGVCSFFVLWLSRAQAAGTRVVGELVVGWGWFTDTGHAGPLGRSHLLPRSPATVGNEMSSHGI